MKFLCMAYEEEQKLNGLSAQEWQALRKETMDYVDALRRSGHLISAEALQSTRTASTVQVRDDRVSVVDGPFTEAKEVIGGFFLIDAADREEAIGIASRWPSARIGRIEVRPIESELSEERRYR